MRFKRLDRHLNGRVGCRAYRRRPGPAPATPVVEVPEPAREPVAAATSDRVARRDAEGNYVDLDGRRRIRAFDPALAGAEPHVQGVEATPVHPDDPEPGAGRRVVRRPKRR